MYLRTIVCLIFLTFSYAAKGQFKVIDTIRTYLSHKPAFYISLDGRNSFIRDRPAIIDGIRLGVSYAGRLRLLLGYYDLRYPIHRTYTYKPGTREEEQRKQRSDLFYLAFTCDYVPYRNEKWKLAVPVQIGYGWANRKEFDMDGNLKVDRDLNFVPLEAGFSASYNILDWLTAGIGAGYRYAVFSNSVSGDFSAPIYTYGLSVDPLIVYNRYLRRLLK